MLAAAVAHASNAALSTDVINTIVGGTMLTLALTRPQLRWIRELPRNYDLQRRWAERALTGFSFAMGGYAAAAMWIALYGQVSSETTALLEGAAYFLVIYAGLVHFEPFVTEWNLTDGFGAFVLYLGVAFSMTVIGAAIATLTLTSSVYLGWTMDALKIFALAGTASWLIRLMPTLIPIPGESKHLTAEANHRPIGEDETD
jgi:hypothetical protein